MELISSIRDWIKKRVSYKHRLYIGHYWGYLRLLFFWWRPRAKFMIVAQGRTGSTLLISLLNSHPDIYCDGEILEGFYYGKIWFFEPYLSSRSKLAWYHQKNVYGFKCKIYQLTETQGVESPHDFLLRRIRRGWKIIHLYRSNTLRQSLSNYFAGQRKYHHISRNENHKRKEWTTMKVDCNFIVEKIKWREEMNRLEHLAVTDIPILSVNYENDLLSPESHQTTANRIFDYLGLDHANVETSLERTSTTRLESMMQNYSELEHALIENELHNYLDD